MKYIAFWGGCYLNRPGQTPLRGDTPPRLSQGEGYNLGESDRHGRRVECDGGECDGPNEGDDGGEGEEVADVIAHDSAPLYFDLECFSQRMCAAHEFDDIANDESV